MSKKATIMAYLVSHAIDGVWTGRITALATDTGITPSTVSSILSDLRTEFRIIQLVWGKTGHDSRIKIENPEPVPAPNYVNGEWPEEKTQQLIALRAGGKPEKKIREIMGITVHAYTNKVSRLIKMGVIPKKKCAREEPEDDGTIEGKLARLATDVWPLESVTALYHGWRAGTSARNLERTVGFGDNAIISKAQQLVRHGLLEARPSCIVRREGPKVPRVWKPRPKVQRPVVEAPVIRLPVRAPAYKPPTVAYVSPSLPMSARCCYPLWGDHERPTHRYCDAPAPLGMSYCPQHHAVVFMRGRKEEAA